MAKTLQDDTKFTEIRQSKTKVLGFKIQIVIVFFFLFRGVSAIVGIYLFLLKFHFLAAEKSELQGITKEV